MSWDALQRAVLIELGHDLYRPLTAAPAPASVSEDAMLVRLAKAAGVAPETLCVHADLVAAAATLRGDAQAKRALWPRLRRMRRDARA